ncbi:hypothetical protein GYH30_015974 [Glycine max]|uniref:ATP-dependent DNA helicase n=1 Tax=Glycine max TaxID=3847 RepID=A0A0R0JQN6_SOYBN|nr:hypothetical protein GYH30_015974 [Glycine max]
MWKTLTSTIRSQRLIVLIVASTLDKSPRDIMGLGNESSTIFGGKVIVFGGDFRQILPFGMDNSSASELNSFSQWILDIGDEKISESNDGYVIIEIPQELLISNFNDPIHGIVNSTYPNLMDQYTNEEYLQCRAILVSTIDIVDEINDFVLSLVPCGEKEYLSLDMVNKSNAADNQALEALTLEFLNSLRTSEPPNQKIKLKVGSSIMLLRNIDQSEGLCNGTRLTVTRLANHDIYSYNVRQFSIMLSYAMTINKS